jgi:hypothetical protein
VLTNVDMPLATQVATRAAMILVNRPVPATTDPAPTRAGPAVRTPAGAARSGAAPSPTSRRLNEWLATTPRGLATYVPDVDSAFRKAVEAGATEQRPVEDQFWGDRMGTLTDPFGHQWSLATHVRDIPPEEMKQRMDEFSQKQSEPA